jgi:hydrogenase maturation protein HypF
VSEGLRIELRGRVQGVGFRPWVCRTARALGLVGRVFNGAGGAVVEAFGTPEALEALRRRLGDLPLRAARIESVEGQVLHGEPPVDFSIAGSEVAGEGPIALVPDLPICDACLAELSDPGSRRHRHPFVTCAQCGPRFTIARALPYDRSRTSMAPFALCAACASEYGDPGDRRFHAEGIACPDCGPTLRCLDAVGAELGRGEAALARAAAALREGLVVAVHGLGGFHLACDAGDEAAVARLRQRKHRPGKPLAVMVSSVAAAEKLAVLDDRARSLLASDVRPIVPLRRRSDAGLASSVSPDSPMVGLFVAYTPLHVLLLGDFGGPLVMTSANRSGEPIADRLEAVLSGSPVLADRVLAHDRAIARPCDDSVALPAATGPILLRRSRGCVPAPIRLARPVGRTILALGGQWNATVCVARGDRAWSSAHVGDLDSPETGVRYAETVERWLDLLGLVPECVAHDLHPAYESTRFAERFPAEQRVAVQHHHAHAASVLAEHGVDGPALALAWDGTGLGTDGAAWGGELLFGDAGGMERLATFRPVRLAGGDQAIREPWRVALALLDDAFDGAPPLDRLGLFRAIAPDRIERVRALLDGPDLAPPAHGVGRLFDAVGALLSLRPFATFSGDLALTANFLASGSPAVPYDHRVDRSVAPWAIDLRAAVRALCEDLLRGRPTGEIADRFHATLVAAGAAVVREALSVGGRAGCEPAGGEAVMVLGGGCFQNPILVDGLERALAPLGRVLRPRRLPPGDGGIALGQVCVADAQLAACGGA